MAKRAEGPPLKEHPRRPGMPDIEGHEQKQDGVKRPLSEAALQQLKKRTVVIKREILGR